MNERLLRY